MSVAVKGNPRESQHSQRVPSENGALRGAPNFIGVRHIGLPAKDPAALAGFYRDVMGMKVMRQTSLPIPDAYAEPIDLDLPEEELFREVHRLAAHFGVQVSSTPR